MRRFTTDELKWQFELGILESESIDLLRNKESDPQSQEKLEAWQGKLDALKTKYLGSIKDVTISLENRMPPLEERFNIHPGCIYKVELESKDIRDMERPQYIGSLKEITIRIDDADFAVTSIVLENVTKHGRFIKLGGGSDHYAIPFDEIRLSRKDKIRSFYLIADEKLRKGK